MFYLAACGLVVVISGCSIQQRPLNREFDALQGQGPVLIVPNDDTVVSTKFFRDKWGHSESIKHLVAKQGVPTAISVEREFLAPSRLKLFYPEQGIVYILDYLNHNWMVSGSEPLSGDDLQVLKVQQRGNTRPTSLTPTRDIYTLTPRLQPLVPNTSQEITLAHPAGDLRGRLKAPTVAGVAHLEVGADGNYRHTVSFQGEDLTLLADWYLGDPQEVQYLAQINHIAPVTPLAIGQQIVLPARGIINSDPLPEALVTY